MDREHITINGLTLIAVRPANAKRAPIVMVHGMFGGAWYFEKYQGFLAERGYPTYALNLRGHHGSRPVASFGRVRVRDYANDVLEIVGAVAAMHGGARPIVIGHSMGGILAQMVAEAGAVRAAVLVCAAPPRGIWVLTWRLMRKLTPRLGALVFGRPLTLTREDDDELALNRVPESERAEMHARFVPESGHAALDLALGVPIRAAKLQCPVLCIGATHDRFVVPRAVRQTANRYGARHIQYEEHAHMVLWEPGWEHSAGDIAAWLETAATE